MNAGQLGDLPPQVLRHTSLHGLAAPVMWMRGASVAETGGTRASKFFVTTAAPNAWLRCSFRSRGLVSLPAQYVFQNSTQWPGIVLVHDQPAPEAQLVENEIRNRPASPPEDLRASLLIEVEKVGGPQSHRQTDCDDPPVEVPAIRSK